MLTIAMVGVLSSLFTELVTYLNKKLSGTVLHGDGAFLVSLVLSIVGASIVVINTSTSISFTYTGLFALASSIWATSQVFYMFIMQKFNLTVQQ